MSDDWDQLLDLRRGVVLRVRMTRDRRNVTNYAVVLAIARDGEDHTVRVYDGSHGVLERERRDSNPGFTHRGIEVRLG